MQKDLLSFLKYCLFVSACCSSLISHKDLEGATSLEREYEYHCHTPSDINEHIPYLRLLARECVSAVEIGVRTIIPTWGILKGLSESPYSPRSYLGIDLDYPPAERLELAKRLAEENGIHFTFWRVNDLHIDLEPTDMLFIDAWKRHTYCHLMYELETFSPRIRRYICLHDTSEPWGDQDDHEYKGDYSEYPSCDKNKKGLWQAVVDFLQNHPEWMLYDRYTNNHGLTILKRKDESVVPLRNEDPRVEYYLKNKMILCTGPALWRYQQLKEMTEADLDLIPFKKIFLSTNDLANMEITFKGRKPVCEYIGDRYKTLDCLNCIITTMKNAANDPEVQDDDIILFKHESVFINDLGLIKKVIGKMLHGADMVVRNTYWGIGTGEFFVKVSAIREMMKDYPILTELPNDRYAKDNGVWNAETYFGAYIVKRIKNPYIIFLSHSHWKFTELGLYHITLSKNPYGPTDDWGYPWWDKKDYDQLYQ